TLFGAEPVTGSSDASDDQSFYTENFDGNLDAWASFMTSGIDSQVTTGVENGNLSVQLSPYEDKLPRFYLVNNTYSYSQVAVELISTNIGNNSNGVSLICQYSDAGWYEFTMSNAGLYSINVYEPSAGYVQLAGGGSAAIKAGKNTNSYEAVCNGNELSIRVNDELVYTIVDTKYNFSDGKIGIGVSSPDLLPVDVSLDALTVSQP
ncbi:MAG TPA: hypothetical protein VJ972_06740, partial [Anaerolineales bacterium]|nr:hypothetical protein [Anaerolineales bacterium]